MKRRRWKTGLALLAGISLLGLSACKSTSNSSSNSKVKTIGVLQLVEHDSLDDAYKGFVAGLKENGYKEGDNLKLVFQNAQNNQDNLKSMSEKLVKEKPDLLLGIATPSAQSLLNETQTTPIVVTAVTDLKAAKLVQSDKKPGGNVTGTTDMVPIKQQIALLMSIVPKAKKVGIMYNSGEANSKIQAALAKKELQKAGVTVVEKTASTTNDVQQVTTSLANNTDAIYIPTDNTFASAASVVGEIAKEKKIPVITGSVGQTNDGGLATYGIDYRSLGKQTAKMAVKILKGKATPATMPVESSTDLQLVVNKEMAKALGIDPSSIKAPK